MGREPFLSSLQSLLAEPDNPAVSQDRGSSQIVADPEIHHRPHETPNSRNRHSRPELQLSLRDEKASKGQNNLARNRESRALSHHQQKDSQVACLVEKIDDSVEDQTSDCQKATSTIGSL